jgi:hypothetical protein
MAGLLDIFNGGGLLDFLRANGAAAIANNPGAMASDTANYGGPAPMSLAPPAAMPQPIAAPPPMPSRAPVSMAGPAPAMPSPAPPAAEPEPQPLIHAPSMDRLSLGAKGFLGNMGAGPIGALIGGIGAAITGQPTDAGTIAQAAKVQQQRALISGLRSRGVSNADITAALANPEYMKKVLDNNVKDQDEFRPATPQERAAAGMTGDNNTPMFINTRTNEPKFGPAQTNVNVSTEKTGQAELATKGVQAFVDAQSAAREAQKRIGMYDAFDKAAQGFAPGATAEVRLGAKRYLKDLGLIRGEDVPDGEVMQMISRELGIHAQPKGQGAVSNYERELFAKSLPNMTQSPEGLRMAIDISRRLEQFDQKVAQIYRDSARDPGNKGLPNYLDVQEKIAALGSPLTESQIMTLGGGTVPAAAAAKSAAPPAPTPGMIQNGYRFKGGNPADKNNWEQVS